MNETLKRGEVWLVNFDPSIGREIQKRRPAIVMSSDALNQYDTVIVVPVTEFKDQHMPYPWCVPISRNSRNGLTKQSTADARQVKSASVERFDRRMGAVPAETVSEIAHAIAICIDL